MTDRILRHDGLARILHWLMAASVLVLLVTGLLPVAGIQFDWVTIHWIAGLVLTAGVLVHILRYLAPRRLARMMLWPRDLKRGLADIGVAAPAGKPGKYTLAQKLMHNAVALFGLVAVVTGVLMCLRIETPFWARNPYILSQSTWGVVYGLHGLAALVFVSLAMLHIYFALRPEKVMYLKAMIAGRVPREAYLAEHEIAESNDAPAEPRKETPS